MSQSLPPLFWSWSQWRLGHGPWKGKGTRSKPRPSQFPWAIPARWWTAYNRMWPSKPPPPPPVQNPPAYTFFQRQSVWVNHPDGAHPDVLVPLMRRGGQTLAIVQVLDGTDVPSTPDTTQAKWDQELKQHIPALKAQGIAVAGWGWGKGHHPEFEAERGWERCGELGLKGYVMNGEKPYEFDGKSGRFVSRFRSLAPTPFPLGWSPEPQLALDHHILQEAEVSYQPQAYTRENRYDVEGCVNVGLRFGYKLAQIVPLVSTHDGTPPAEHVVSAHRVGAKWLILYPTNSCMDKPQVFEELGHV